MAKLDYANVNIDGPTPFNVSWHFVLSQHLMSSVVLKQKQLRTTAVRYANLYLCG